MKWVFILIFLIVVFLGIKLYPMVLKKKACYDTAGKTITDINYNVVARGFGKEDICSRRSDALLTLEDCVRSATGGSKLAKYTNSVIDDVLFALRPFTVGVSEQISQHDADCSDYSVYQLE